MTSTASFIPAPSKGTIGEQEPNTHTAESTLGNESTGTLSLQGLQAIINDLLRVCDFLHQKGWTPATSSNFSARNPENHQHFFISASGKDKSCLTSHDFIAMNLNGNVVFRQDRHQQPSAEMLLHAMIYERFPHVHSVLHTHSLPATVLSKLYEAQGELPLKNFELLKGFEGVKTHETNIPMPIFPNSQSIPTLVRQINAYLDERQTSHPETPCYGLLIAGHGLYAWGETLEQAKRHVETIEFLLTSILELKRYGYADYS